MLESLRAAVEGLHNCQAVERGSVRVVERFEGAVAWEGDVAVFDLIGHPTAKIAYAWSEPVKGSDRRRFYAVLHEEPVDSPERAVRASIVSEYRQTKGEA